MRSIAHYRDPARSRSPRLPFLRPLAALLLSLSGLAVAVPHAAAADPGCTEGTSICDVSGSRNVPETMTVSTTSAFSIDSVVGASNPGDFEILATIVNGTASATFTSNGLTTRQLHHSPNQTSFPFGTVTAGATAGTFQIQVDDNPKSYNPPTSGGTVYTVTVNPAGGGVPTSLTITGGIPQSAVVGQKYATSIDFHVTDNNGALSNQTVNLAVDTTNPDCTGSPATVTGLPATLGLTNVNGDTSIKPNTLTAAGGIGTVCLKATTSIGGVTTPFELTNIGGPPAQLILSCPSAPPGNTAVVGGNSFSGAFSATVADSANRALPNQPITFSTAAFVPGATNDPVASGTLLGDGITQSTTITSDNTGVAYLTTAGGVQTNRKTGTWTLTATSGAFTKTCKLTNIAGAPATINFLAPAAISLQEGSQIVTPAGGNDLKLQVLDQYGNPVPNQTVTLAQVNQSAPGVAAPAPACPGVTQTTDLNGILDCGPLTAGTVVGSLNIKATAGTAFNTSNQITITNGPPDHLLYVSGGGSAPAGTVFPNPLIAQVVDKDGNPVNGAIVSISNVTSDGSASLAGTVIGTSKKSNVGVDGKAGEVSFDVTANTFADPSPAPGYQVTLTLLGAAGTPASQVYVLHNTANTVAKLTLVSGSNVNTPEGSVTTTPIVVRLADQFGNVLPGPATYKVTFSSPTSPAGAVLASGTTETDPVDGTTGLATSTLYAARCGLGSYQITATSPAVSAGQPGDPTFGGTPLYITESTIVGLPNAIALTSSNSGSGQSATVGTVFNNQLQAQVTDSCGTPVPNVKVTFTGPTTGAGIKTTQSATTDNTGVASVTVSANNTAGGPYNVTAIAAGGTNPTTTFALTNTAGPVASCKFVVSSSTPTTIVGQNFDPANFAVQAVDGSGNAVNGAPVVYAVPGAGIASLTGLTGGPTSGTGATAGQFTPGTVTANTIAGQYMVTVTAGGFSCGSRLVTNTAGPFAKLVVVAPTPPTASTQVNTAFNVPLQVEAEDTFGNPVAGVSASFSGPFPPNSPNPTASGNNLSNVGPSGADGLITLPAGRFTANGVAGGPYTITVTAVGTTVTNTQIQFTNLAAPATSCVFTPANAANTGVVAGQPFGANAFQVKVTDGSAAPVSGATIVYSVTPGTNGATASGFNTTTNTTGAAGTASPASVTAGTTAGTFTVSAIATSNGVTLNCAPINVTTVAGPATQLVAISGTPQTVASGATFANLVVQLQDVNGNAINTSGIPVNFAASPAGCVTNLPANNSVVTTANGQATFMAPVAQATTTNVPCTIIATATGVAGAATFTLNITGSGGGSSQYTLQIITRPVTRPARARPASASAMPRPSPSDW